MAKKLISYDDTKPGLGLPDAVAGKLDNRFDRVDVAPTGTLEGDKAAVIAAAQQAAAVGRKTVRLAPGHYLLDGLTPGDIEDRYLVGDGATVSPTSWVYPFASADMITSVSNKSRQSGGRGRIAFEVDDGLRLHWTSLFPLCKRLGITMGTAWHTANGEKWIHEAYRHGWEIIAHLPEDITATVHRNNGDLDAKAKASLDAVVGITGNPKNVGFVYPQHVRDLDTDRILSKYFTRGRGRGVAEFYPRDSGHPWLTSAKAVDPEITTGHMSQNLKNILSRVAATDSQMVFYIHWSQPNIDAGHPQALTEIVEYSRDLGIEIVNPGQVWQRREVIEDRYFEDTSRWATGGIASWDETQAYHGGRSVKFQAPEAALGTGHIQTLPVELPHRTGMFAVYRASFRRKNAEITGIGLGNGLRFEFAGNRRVMTGDNHSPVTAKGTSRRWPKLGGDGKFTAAEWMREQDLIYIPASFVSGSFRLSITNLPAGQVMNVDEIQIQHLGWATQAGSGVTLAGTANTFVELPIPSIADLVQDVSISSPTAGAVSLTPYSDNGFIVKSSNAADVTQKVFVSYLPGLPFAEGSLVAEGA